MTKERQDQFLIFDMDGVIIDSNPFHKLAWKSFCEAHQCSLTDEDLQREVYGKTNEDALKFVFGDQLQRAEVNQYAAQKEQLYRELFKPSLKPVPGLVEFLEQARASFGALAVATSAPPENVDFVLDTLNLRRFFSVIVDETMVSKGKPDPEIYLKTASRLNASPAQCIVFEDSLSGIRSARAAGMTVVGITTTHSAEELADQVAFAVPDFCNLMAKLPLPEKQPLQI